MKIGDARFMLMEINSKLQNRRKPLETDTRLQLEKVRVKIGRGEDLNDVDSAYLTKMHARITELRRIKW